MISTHREFEMPPRTKVIYINNDGPMCCVHIQVEGRTKSVGGEQGESFVPSRDQRKHHGEGDI